MNTNTLTRKTAHRGQQVTLTDRHGRVITGTLTAWGAQIIEVAPDEASREAGWNWKREPFRVFDTATVVAGTASAPCSTW